MTVAYHRMTPGFVVGQIFRLTRLKVPSKQLLWPRSKIRRASVNNFGFGGTNSHIILEQAPLRKVKTRDNNITNGTLGNKLNINGTLANGVSDLRIPPAASQAASKDTQANFQDKNRYLFVFSAADETAAKAQISSLRQYLKQRTPLLYRSLYERLASTLQRRTLLQWRSASVVTCQTELIERMD